MSGEFQSNEVAPDETNSWRVPAKLQKWTHRNKIVHIYGDSLWMCH